MGWPPATGGMFSAAPALQLGAGYKESQIIILAHSPESHSRHLEAHIRTLRTGSNGGRHELHLEVQASLEQH